MASSILVVPCYNEAERLDLDAYRRFAAETECVRFLFVDDGSSDNTAAVIRGLVETDPGSFELLELGANRGKAGAVQAGVLSACERGPDFVGYWDADLSTPLSELPAFLDVLRARPEIRMVFGARVNLLGRSIRRKLLRHYIGRIFATAVAAALRLPIYDTQCGAKVFRVTDELIENFREPFLSKWIFDVELIARFIEKLPRGGDPRDACRIYELPLTAWYDVEGSKLRLRDFVTVTVDFARIYGRYLRRRR